MRQLMSTVDADSFEWRKDAEYWYANGGAKPPLANEKPQGKTVNYDEPVARRATKWLETE